jgi:hypothetical protein
LRRDDDSKEVIPLQVHGHERFDRSSAAECVLWKPNARALQQAPVCINENTSAQGAAPDDAMDGTD